MGRVADFDFLCFDESDIQRVEEWLVAEGFADVRRETGNGLCDLHASLEIRAGDWVPDIAGNVKKQLDGTVGTIRVTVR